MRMDRGRSPFLAALASAARAAVLVLAAVFLVYLGRQAYGFGYQVFAQKPMTAEPGKNVSVTLTDGMPASEIGELLEAKELIRDARVFRIQMALYKYKDDIRGGTYILNTSQTADEMLAVLSGQAEAETEAEAAQ